MSGGGKNNKASDAVPAIEELDRLYMESYEKVPEGLDEVAWHEFSAAQLAEIYAENDPEPWPAD